MDLDNPNIVAALIAAAVSVVTVLSGFLFKAWFERYFLIFKLESEHRYEQKKKIKEVLARYKTQLLDAGESLNHRLWNFSENYKENWHTASSTGELADQYYLASFVYRLLAFFAWVRKVESKMVHLDTTIASKDDLHFVKFLRVLAQTLCDVELFSGLKYDKSRASDHFFRNNFAHICECFWSNDEVLSFSDFKENKGSCCDEAAPMVRFVSGMNPDEERLRWDRLQALHYVLLMFMNTYGYDFQYTDETKMRKLLSRQPRPNKVVRNLNVLLSRMHLHHQKEVRKILEAL
jgi:hypothetical protein